MKLFFSPGACSLSPHIALREAGLSFSLDRVDLREKQTQDGSDFRRINPKGYVPALMFDDGEVLTEGVVIVQYIADQRPDTRLAPPPGTRARLRLQEWLNFIATELHKGFGALRLPGLTDDLRQAVKERLAVRFEFLRRGLENRPYLLGNDFTVADGYAYYTLRSWQSLVGREMSEGLKNYADRIATRPAVQAALQAEGLPG